MVWCDQLEDVLERLDLLEKQNDFLLEKVDFLDEKVEFLEEKVDFLEAENVLLRADYDESKEELGQLQVNFYLKKALKIFFMAFFVL